MRKEFCVLKVLLLILTASGHEASATVNAERGFAAGGCFRHAGVYRTSNEGCYFDVAATTNAQTSFEVQNCLPKALDGKFINADFAVQRKQNGKESIRILHHFAVNKSAATALLSLEDGSAFQIECALTRK